MSEEIVKFDNDKLPYECHLCLSDSQTELTHNLSISRQKNEGMLRQALLNSSGKELKLGEDKMWPLIIDLRDSETRKHKCYDVEGIGIQLTYASGGDSSEYTALLSQLASSALPTISCSQVSSVLSALEPNSILSEVVTNHHKTRVKCKGTEKANEPSSEGILTCRMEKRNENKKSWYYCPCCELVCLDEEKANYHGENCTGIAKRICCLACDNSFKSMAILQAHLIIDHKVALAELKEVISINLDTINNKSNNTGDIGVCSEPPIQLNNNSKRGMSDKISKKELKKVTSVKIEKEVGPRCGIEGCAVRLVSPSNMSYHRQCHDGVKWKCLECCENSSSWANLSLHLWKHHSIDMELYSCDQCSYKTNSLSKLLNLHRRTHGNERPFLCDSCGKGFKTSKQLRNHKTVHKVKQNGENENISCSICGRTFTCMRMLRHHIDIVHRKLRPYLCSDCGHSAASRSSLRMHSRQHTGEKPYSCNECEYRTSDHNTFRRHKMRHTGAKHYSCPHCPYACIQSSTFKSHLKNKHPGLDDGLMFSCEVCPFRTVKKDNFLAHISYHSLKTSDHELSKDSDIELQDYNLRVQNKLFKMPFDRTVHLFCSLIHKC